MNKKKSVKLNMKISHLDHFVLTVANIEITCQFYQSALNFEVITFAENRKALQFGNQKINLHQAGKEFELKHIVQPQDRPIYVLLRKHRSMK